MLPSKGNLITESYLAKVSKQAGDLRDLPLIASNVFFLPAKTMTECQHGRNANLVLVYLCTFKCLKCQYTFTTYTVLFYVNTS